MPAPNGVDDFVGIGDPLEGFGMGVVIFEETIDRGLEVDHGSEDAAFEAALGEGGEEALDSIEPGCRSRCELEGPARVPRQPSADGGMFVGGVVVHDGVDGLAGGNLALHRIEKADELLMAMTLHIAAHHGSVEDVHGRKQRCRSVPLVIVDHRSGAALLRRQPGLGSVEDLDLALFVDGQNHGVRRRIDVEADHIAQLLDEFGIPGKLELANAMGLQPMGPPDTLNRGNADAGHPRHGCACPTRGLGRRRFHCRDDDACGDRGVELGDARGAHISGILGTSPVKEACDIYERSEVSRQIDDMAKIMVGDCDISSCV